MIEAAKHLICWDLDDTLGHFSPYSYDRDGEQRLRVDPEVYLPYGINELLKEFSEENSYRSVVTTAARREYAEYALE